MSGETKVIGILTIIFLVIFAVAFLLVSRGSETTPIQVDNALLVKSDSHQTSPEAKVSLVEFGDFQCPACASVHPGVKALMAEYGNRVNFVFRHFPLAQHINAIAAAGAAEAADSQGKFWEMYDKLYENQAAWATHDKPTEIFSGFAKDLGLDMQKFESDMSGQTYMDKINKDRVDGNAVGIDSTPTFFVNGQKVSSFNDLKTIIDQKLSELEIN